MPTRLTPMIHVPDVRATAAWYQSIGFTLARWHISDADGVSSGPLPEKDVELDWAMVRLGDNEVMFNAGGRLSDAPRRDVDLYVQMTPGSANEGVDALNRKLKGKAEVVEAPYDAFHGNREIIIRDLNGFWITFAEPTGAAN